MNVDRTAAIELLRTGAIVDFRVASTQVHEGPDAAEFTVEINLEFPPDPETEESDLSWGAFGFVFVIGVLSFADARPREASVLEYAEEDDFHVGDLISSLRWEDGALKFEADYIRGRRMKTSLVLRPDDSGRLTTTGRGKAALHWLDRLKGQKPLQLVS
ncbi:MAG: hypothetical protein U1F35_01225 [Steroidobacteraceae bacterium]